MSEAFFDDRYSPRRPGARREVPIGVREGLLEWLRNRNVMPARVGDLLLTKLGSSSWRDLAEELDGWFGPEVGSSVMLRLDGAPDSSSAPEFAAHHLAVRGLETIPTDLFLSALECVAQAWRGPDLRETPASLDFTDLVSEVNRVFDLRGVDFRMSDTGWIDWHGDKGAHEVVVEPALAVLADVRLHGARSEFEAALAHLRVGSDKEREDAIEEAAKSVESAMKVVLALHKVQVSSSATATPLFNALKDANLVAQYAEYPCSARAISATRSLVTVRARARG
jgi:hypothetical protein